MKPAQWRVAVGYTQEQFGFSLRRACRLVSCERSTIRYQPRRRGDDISLRARLRDLAAQRPRFGYRRLHVLLRREGIVVNHKRVERLYREEGLAVRRRTRKALTAIRRGRGFAWRRGLGNLRFIISAILESGFIKNCW